MIDKVADEHTEIRLEERVIEIEPERLRDFEAHPFHVTEDDEMKNLMESIKLYGILNPLIVRPRPEGFYEIICLDREGKVFRPEDCCDRRRSDRNGNSGISADRRK